MIKNTEVDLFDDGVLLTFSPSDGEADAEIMVNLDSDIFDTFAENVNEAALNKTGYESIIIEPIEVRYDDMILGRKVISGLALDSHVSIMLEDHTILLLVASNKITVQRLIQ